MKIKKNTSNRGETSATIDLFEGRKLPEGVKDRIRDEVGTFLVEESLVALSESKSPLIGESIPALKKGNYRKKKMDELGTNRADIQFSGETLDEFTFTPTKDGIKIGVFGDRAVVADGHNNLSGKSSLPRRRWIPDSEQNYKTAIQKEVNSIIATAISEEIGFKKSEFKGVTTAKELTDVLKSKLGSMTKGELSLVVYRDEDLLDLLTDLDLIKLLP